MSRRRLFKGAAAGAGVLLAVQAKSALGQEVLCQSPSAMMSGNLSRPANADGTCSGGRSPGYWMQPQHFGAWRAAGLVPPTFAAPFVECSTNGQGQLAMENITSPGTTFQDAFNGASPKMMASGGAGPKGKGKKGDSEPVVGEKVVDPCSLWLVLGYHNQFVDGSTLFHFAAAYLNAKYYQYPIATGAYYPLTVAQVQQMFLETVVQEGEYQGQAGWDKEFVVGYIESLYDFNAPVVNYCTAAEVNG